MRYPTDAPQVRNYVVRQVPPGDVNGVVEVMTRSRPRFAGARHPKLYGAIVAHWFRKLSSRVSARRRNAGEHVTDAALAPEVALPEDVAERLGNRPPAFGSPRPGEHGPHIAEVLYVGVLPDQRGRRVGVGMYTSLFHHLQSRGYERCDASFSRRDPAAIRMHCNFPFTVSRLPGGYRGSLRFADLASGEGMS